MTSSDDVADDTPARWTCWSGPLTVTIAVENGPTVRITYDGTWVSDTCPHVSSVEVRHQAGPLRRPRRWLRDLIADTGGLLIWYAVHAKEWPPELREAPRSPERDA